MRTGIGELDRVLGGGARAGLAGAARRRSRHRQVDAAAAGARRRWRARASRCSTSRARSRRSRSALRADRLGVARRGAATCSPRPQLERILDAGRRDARRRCWRSTRSRRCTRATLESAPGSLGQVRESAGRLVDLRQDATACRSSSSATSPRTARSPARETLEHMVDTRALLRGRARPPLSHPARGQEPLRLDQRDRRLRDEGRAGCGEVANPSALFLAERPLGRAGLGGGRRRRRHAADPRRDPGAGGADARSARRGAPRSASTPTASRCCSRSSRSRCRHATCSARTSSSTSPAACASTSRPRSRRASRRWPRAARSRPVDPHTLLLRRGRPGRRGARGRPAPSCGWREAQQARLPPLRPAGADAHAAPRQAGARAHRRARRRRRARGAARLIRNREPRRRIDVRLQIDDDVAAGVEAHGIMNQ